MRITNNVIKKVVDIGDITVMIDQPSSTYCVRVFNEKEGWSIDPYCFVGEQTVESVFNLVVALVVEMSPLITGLQSRLIGEQPVYEETGPYRDPHDWL